jgi:hypothetical protein
MNNLFILSRRIDKKCINNIVKKYFIILSVEFSRSLVAVVSTAPSIYKTFPSPRQTILLEVTVGGSQFNWIFHIIELSTIYYGLV